MPMATVYCTATSLDGFIADQDESLSWLFATAGGSAPTDYPSDEPADDSTGDPAAEAEDPPAPDAGLPELHFDRFFAGVGAIVCGINTFEWVRRDLTRDGRPFVWPYSLPTWVVTHRDPPPVEGVRYFSGDVGELHPDLVRAAGGRDVWIVGGGDLAGQFADRGLLDLLWVHQCPVVLGAGRPLLPRRLRLHRERVEVDGQFTAMLLRVEGPEPPGDA